MTRWAEHDARRLHRRFRHAVTRGDGLDAGQVSYLRRTAMLLLLDEDAGLPHGWADDLRQLLGILERVAELHEEAT